ncbi:hypothetical protein LMTR3_29200 [Bradyrhizobium sp. LMTR 3]|nr:hypothetical protein LMTR3_29200 [Bradyrhizobium sp. LMTR 3]
MVLPPFWQVATAALRCERETGRTLHDLIPITSPFFQATLQALAARCPVELQLKLRLDELP